MLGYFGNGIKAEFSKTLLKIFAIILSKSTFI